MNYRRGRKTFSRRTYLLVTVIIALAILFVWGIAMPKVATDTLATIASPFWKARDMASASAGTMLVSKQELIKENEALRFELREARLALLGTTALRRELNALLGVVGDVEEEERVVARVLARPPETLYDTFIINRGTADGIGKGDVVFAGGNVVLGVVSAVHGETAQVQLYSTDGVETEALIGQDFVTATARGQGNGNFIAHVPRDVVVTEESTILLPRGGSEMVLGVVGAIQEESGNTVKTILFRSPVNTATALFVSVATE